MLAKTLAVPGTINTRLQLKDPQHGHVQGPTVPRARQGRT